MTKKEINSEICNKNHTDYTAETNSTSHHYALSLGSILYSQIIPIVTPSLGLPLGGHPLDDRPALHPAKMKDKAVHIYFRAIAARSNEKFRQSAVRARQVPARAAISHARPCTAARGRGSALKGKAPRHQTMTRWILPPGGEGPVRGGKKSNLLIPADRYQ